MIGLDAEPLADIAGDRGGQRLVRRPLHHLQRRADLRCRHDVEIRRLPELDLERVLQRAVEDRFAGGVEEIGQQERLPRRQRRRRAAIPASSRRRPPRPRAAGSARSRRRRGGCRSRRSGSGRRLGGSAGVYAGLPRKTSDPSLRPFDASAAFRRRRRVLAAGDRSALHRAQMRGDFRGARRPIVAVASPSSAAAGGASAPGSREASPASPAGAACRMASTIAVVERPSKARRAVSIS